MINVYLKETAMLIKHIFLAKQFIFGNITARVCSAILLLSYNFQYKHNAIFKLNT